MRVESVKPASVEPKTAASEKKEGDGAFAELVGLLLNILAPASEPAVATDTPTGDAQAVNRVQSPKEMTTEHVILALLEGNTEAQVTQAAATAQVIAAVLEEAVPPNIYTDESDETTSMIETDDSPLPITSSGNSPTRSEVKPTSYAIAAPQATLLPGTELPVVSQTDSTVGVIQRGLIDVAKNDQPAPAPSVVEPPRVGQGVLEPPARQSATVEVQPPAALSSPEAPIALNGVLPPVEASSLQALRTEIVSFTNNPGRPAVVLEVSPPEYGRVLVSAERDVNGQVSIRLVVENSTVKAAVMEQLPPLPTTASVVVVTAEEHREWREQGQRRRNQQEKQAPKKETDHKVEFVV